LSGGRRRRRFRRALDESEDSEEFEVAEPEVELSEEEQQLAGTDVTAAALGATGAATAGTALAKALFAGRRRRRFRRSLFVINSGTLAQSRRRDRRRDGRRRRFRRALDESEDSEEFEVAEPEVELSEEEQQLADFLNKASEEEIESAIANVQNEEEVKAILSVIKYGKKYWPTIKKWGKKVWNNRKKHWNNAKKGFKKFGSKVKKGWNKVFGGRRRKKFQLALDDSEDSEEFEVAEPEVELSEEEQHLADFLSNASEDQIADSFSEEELAETDGMSEEEVSDWFFEGLYKKIKKAGRKAGRWGSKAFKSVKKKVSGRGF